MFSWFVKRFDAYKYLINCLPSDDFAITHSSYIIRLDKIKTIEDEMVSLGDKTLPISRTYKSDFLNKLNYWRKKIEK